MKSRYWGGVMCVIASCVSSSGGTTCNPVCSVHVAFQCCAGARPWPCRLRVDCPNLEGRSFGGLPVIVVSVSVRTGGCVPNHSTGWTSQPVALVMSVRLRLQRTHMWMPHTSTYMQYLYATNACRCILCVCATRFLRLYRLRCAIQQCRDPLCGTM